MLKKFREFVDGVTKPPSKPSVKSQDLENLLDTAERRLSGVPWVDSAKLAKELNEIRLELERPVRLSFVGNFSVGKSMVINSILGEEIAPVNQTPTTAVICHFRYGDTKRVRFHYKDGSVEEEGFFAFKQFSDHSQIDEDEDSEQIERIQQVDHVEIFFPNETLRDVTLVDTPGLGAVTEKDEETTKAHLRDADAVCWVFDAEAVGKGDEVKRIRGLADEFRSAFALINQCDKKPPRTRPKLRNRVEKLVGEHFDDILLYTAKETLESKLGETELLDADVRHLETDLAAEVRRRVKDHAQELRERRARAHLSWLSDALLGELEIWNDGIQSYLDFFGALDSELDRLRNRLQQKAKNKLNRLNRRLESASHSNARTLKRSFTAERGFFSSDGNVSTSGLERFHNNTHDEVSDAFQSWFDFLGEFREQLNNSWERVLEESITSEETEDEEGPEKHDAQVVDIWRSFDHFCHSFWQLVGVWEQIIFSRYAHTPNDHLRGALNGTFRSLHFLGGLPDVAEYFQEQSLSDIRENIEFLLYPQFAGDFISERLNSSDPSENLFQTCFGELRNTIEEFREDFEERQSALQSNREFLEAL